VTDMIDDALAVRQLRERLVRESLEREFEREKSVYGVVADG